MKAGKQLALPGPVTFRATPGSFLTVGDKGYRGDLRVAKAGGEAPAGQRRRARGVPARRRPRRDAEGLAARGAQGAGGRRAHLCRGASREGEGLRPLLRLAEPGVLRRRARRARDRRARSPRRRARSSRTRARRRRRSTSPRAAAGRSARSTSSAPTFRISRRSTTAGTRCRRTSGGPLSSSPAPSSRSASGSAARSRTSRISPARPAAPRRFASRRRPARRDVRLSDVRARLGLKSTGFRLGMMRLDGPTVTAPEREAPTDGARPERRGRRPRAPWQRGRVGQGAAGRARGGRDVRRVDPPRRDDRVPADLRRPLRAGAHGPVQGVSRRALLGALACCAALAFPAASLGARSHVGIEPGADPAVVARAIERATGARVERLAPLRALTADASPRRSEPFPGLHGSSRRASAASRSSRPTRSPRASGTRSRTGPTTPGRRCPLSRPCASR